MFIGTGHLNHSLNFDCRTNPDYKSDEFRQEPLRRKRTPSLIPILGAFGEGQEAENPFSPSLLESNARAVGIVGLVTVEHRSSYVFVSHMYSKKQTEKNHPYDVSSNPLAYRLFLRVSKIHSLGCVKNQDLS